MRFRQTELPGQAGVFDTGLRRGSGPAVVTTNQHDIGMAFGHTRGNRADPDLGDQLHADARLGVGVLQVVNELGQVFD